MIANTFDYDYGYINMICRYLNHDYDSTMTTNITSMHASSVTIMVMNIQTPHTHTHTHISTMAGGS